MGFIQDLIAKAVKPIGSGNAFFEEYGIPGATNQTSYINAYSKVVYACVSAIAEEVGKIEIKVEKAGKDIEKHEILTLFNNPNPDIRQTQYNLFELTQGFIELAGECFWYMATGELSKKPKQIFILRPDRMAVSVGHNGAITGYVLTKDNGEKVTFEVNEIIHFKMPNPKNPYRGLGTVEAAMTYVQTEQYASEWTRNAFYNDASPRGIVSLKGTISDTEFAETKRKWNKQYAGVRNANKTAILRGMDIEYTKIGSGLDDIAIKELRAMSRDDIMFMFRVSKPILGIVEDVNRSNGKEAMYAFMQRVIKPKMERIIDTLQSTLGNYYGVELTFEDPVEEDDAEKATYYEKMLNVGLTINEIREELGKDPITGGDSIYQPLNLMPIGTVAKKEPGIKLVSRTTKKTKKTIEAEIVKDAFVDNKLDKNLIHWKSLNGIENSWLKKIELTVQKVLKMQEKDVLGKLKPKMKKDVTGYEPDIAKYKEIWIKELTPIFEGLYQDTGAYATSIVEGTGTKSIKIKEFVMTDQMRKKILDRIERTFVDFDTQTAKEISATLLEGMTEESSLADQAARVETVYGGAMGYRAERLSQTETHHMANQASLDAYRGSAVVTGKQWYAEPGACGFCQEMNGKIVDLDANFIDLGGQVTYLDADEVAHTMGIDYEPIGTGDLHPHCQCTQLPYSADYEETGHFLPAGGYQEGP